MSWVLKGTSMLPDGTIIDEATTDEPVVHRAALFAVSDTGSSRREARLRLADKLERLISELRK